MLRIRGSARRNAEENGIPNSAKRRWRPSERLKGLQMVRDCKIVLAVWGLLVAFGLGPLWDLWQGPGATSGFDIIKGDHEV